METVKFSVNKHRVCSKLKNDKGEEQQADIRRLQSIANRNGVIKQEHTELEEGCFVCTPKFNAVNSVLRDWDWIVDGGYMVSEEHADKKWFNQAMFIYEQELFQNASMARSISLNWLRLL